jgi:flagellar hook-associated protein 2
MAISLSGLSSGLDTESIITQLLNVERQPKTRMTLADTQAQSRQATLRDLQTKLGAVRDAATALRSVSTWGNTQKLTSSDAARVAVSTSGTAAPGSHRIEVGRLAVAAQHAFDFSTSASPQAIKIGGYTLDVDADATAATVAAKLNADKDAPVSAVVAGGLLVLTSRTTGVASDFTVDPSSPLTEQPAYARAGLDAQYKLDGVDMPDSPSNVVKSAILGVDVTLKATTAPSTPVTVDIPAPGVDADVVKAKVKAFVTAYNGAVDFMRDELAEKPVKDPATNAQATQGLFFGDSMLSGVLSSMRKEIGDLSTFGISTGAVTGKGTPSADAIAGRLTLDDTKLTAAIAADPDTLRTRIQDLGQRVTTVVTPIAGAGVSERIKSVDATRKRLADQMAAIDVRVADKEKRLRAQFAAMESALAASQSAQSQMTAQLKGLGS